MQIKIFTIPINAVQDYEKELNVFLSKNKIIELEKHLIQSGGQAYWCIYISYVSNNTSYNGINSSKIDYKKVLTEKEFIKYERLRTVRREISKEDAVSAFVIATNEELAQIVKLPELTISKLKEIKGFGDKKVEKYGKRIIEKMQRYETDW